MEARAGTSGASIGGTSIAGARMPGAAFARRGNSLLPRRAKAIVVSARARRVPHTCLIGSSCMIAHRDGELAWIDSGGACAPAERWAVQWTIRSAVRDRRGHVRVDRRDAEHHDADAAVRDLPAAVRPLGADDH